MCRKSFGRQPMFSVKFFPQLFWRERIVSLVDLIELFWIFLRTQNVFVCVRETSSREEKFHTSNKAPGCFRLRVHRLFVDFWGVLIFSLTIFPFGRSFPWFAVFVPFVVTYTNWYSEKNLTWSLLLILRLNCLTCPFVIDSCTVFRSPSKEVSVQMMYAPDFCGKKMSLSVKISSIIWCEIALSLVDSQTSLC